VTSIRVSACCADSLQPRRDEMVYALRTDSKHSLQRLGVYVAVDLNHVTADTVSSIERSRNIRVYFGIVDVFVQREYYTVAVHFTDEAGISNILNSETIVGKEVILERGAYIR
jgi:hypothetical protein